MASAASPRAANPKMVESPASMAHVSSTYACVGSHTCTFTLLVMPLTVPVMLPIPAMSDAHTGSVGPFVLRPF